MRPKKTRWIKCDPGERCFRPQSCSAKTLEGVVLTLDEFEAVRLCDFQRLDQKAIASRMKVHPSTISRILASARAKISDALVNLKAVKVEGGCCKTRSGKLQKRR